MNTTSNEQSLTARDLLYAYLELRGLSPNLADWNETKLEANPPRLIRLKRLQALFKAFDLPWNPTSFEEGRFLDSNTSCFESLKRRAIDETGVSAEDIRETHLRVMFWILLNYRMSVARALSHAPEGSVGLFSYACVKIEEVNSSLRRRVSPIDDILSEMIDATGRSFSVSALVSQYGYPDDDLNAMDVAWW